MSVSSIVNFGAGIALKVSTNVSPSSIVVSSLDSDHSFQLVEILTIDRNSSKDRAVDAVITRRFKRNSGSRRQVSVLVQGPSKFELIPMSSSSTRVATSNRRRPSGTGAIFDVPGTRCTRNAMATSFADWYRAEGAC